MLWKATCVVGVTNVEKNMINEDGIMSKDFKENQEKPSWLLTAQKIYPMSDEEYFRMLKAAERTAKIELDLRNAFTSPNYQRRHIKNMGEIKVVDAAITLRNCKLVMKK